jgi:alpha-N-acetylglucosamine transferase
MPKFEKGNKLGGRKKGSLNRSTEMAKLTLARLADRGLNNINEDLDKIREKDPIEAAKLYLKLLEFVVPKLKAVEMQVSGEVNHKVEQIKVEVIEKVKEIDVDATEYTNE